LRSFCLGLQGGSYTLACRDHTPFATSALYIYIHIRFFLLLFIYIFFLLTNPVRSSFGHAFKILFSSSSSSSSLFFSKFLPLLFALYSYLKFRFSVSGFIFLKMRSSFPGRQRPVFVAGHWTQQIDGKPSLSSNQLQ
jgi:hypothetical protein